MLFPLNTHFAVDSRFWGTLMMLMLALWLVLCVVFLPFNSKAAH